MKKLLLAVILCLSTITTAALAEVKVGIILGFTGPIESLTPAMRDSAKLALNEVSGDAAFLGGESITILEGDSTCVDSAAAVTAAVEQHRPQPLLAPPFGPAERPGRPHPGPPFCALPGGRPRRPGRSPAAGGIALFQRPDAAPLAGACRPSCSAGVFPLFYRVQPQRQLDLIRFDLI